ncbi:MAG: carboxypeptidase-like regulatory domain-containing protein [Pirellulales bacterium]
MSHHWLILAVVLAVGMTGCDSGPQVAPVEGTVLLDGEPLVGASVNTQPLGTSSNPNPGAGSFGTTDEQGHYNLELVDPPIAGAVLGEHRVTITRKDKDNYSSSDKFVLPQGIPWPVRYGDGSLRLTVTPEGNIEANFDLTLKQ